MSGKLTPSMAPLTLVARVDFAEILSLADWQGLPSSGRLLAFASRSKPGDEEQAMWHDLLRVDWRRLTHAYGSARDTPGILRDMIADDASVRERGWNAFYGALNHQGDYYDSTVATIPFLVEAVAHRGTPDRAHILHYFRERWLEAGDYAGDPLLPEPPGGTDIPTPIAPQGPQAAVSDRALPGEEGFDNDADRRMDLCAWQTARAIQAGRPVFERLACEADRNIAAAAAAILLLWPESRAAGKRVLIETLVEEPSPVEQARHILELGVYGAGEDVAVLAPWCAPDRPAVTRAAAALVWAWIVNPEPLPEAAVLALDDASAADSNGFSELPLVGVYSRGSALLPANAAALVLRLVGSGDKDVRWCAVQALEITQSAARHLTAARIVPVLIEKLSDPYNRVRSAAATALAQRGEAILDVAPNAAAALIGALEAHESPDWGDKFRTNDDDAYVSQQAASLLAALTHRLSAAQRQQALAGIDRAARRCVVRQPTLSERLRAQGELLVQPPGLPQLFAAADRPLSSNADRRLADIYARTPEQAIAAAIAALRAADNAAIVRTPEQAIAAATAALRAADNRTIAMGAARWLTTLGPAAKPALDALDAMSSRETTTGGAARLRAASAYIHQSLLVTPDVGSEPSAGEPTVRHHVARLLRAAAEAGTCGATRVELVAEASGLLAHSDAYVRCEAAHALAVLKPEPDQIAGVLPILEGMLACEACAEVGIAGEYELSRRLYHWRRERRSPRAGAIRALLAVGWSARGDILLKAMLAEAILPRVLCVDRAALSKFAIAHWRLAVDAAGGLPAVDRLIRTVRLQCLRQYATFVCAGELADVIRQLSGRLGQ